MRFLFLINRAGCEISPIGISKIQLNRIFEAKKIALANLRQGDSYLIAYGDAVICFLCQTTATDNP